MDLKEITVEVCRIARMAGLFLKNERLSFSTDRVEKKSAHDYVSYVDRASERMIVTELHNLLPEAGFIVEEGSATYADEPYCWVVDPLDGTTNYIHDTAPYCVSIALRSKTELLAGVVYEPTRNECFSAWRGGGAFLNGQPIHVSTTDMLDNALVVAELTSKSDNYKPTAEHLIHELYGHTTGIRMVGSAALAISYVAAGRYDAWLEAFIGRWDFAAAALLVQEAGGRVSDFYGSDSFLDGHHIVATNGLLHTAMLDIVGGALPDGM